MFGLSWPCVTTLPQWVGFYNRLIHLGNICCWLIVWNVAVLKRTIVGCDPGKSILLVG